MVEYGTASHACARSREAQARELRLPQQALTTEPRSLPREQRQRRGADNQDIRRRSDQRISTRRRTDRVWGVLGSEQRGEEGHRATRIGCCGTPPTDSAACWTLGASTQFGLVIKRLSQTWKLPPTLSFTSSAIAHTRYVLASSGYVQGCRAWWGVDTAMNLLVATLPRTSPRTSLSKICFFSSSESFEQNS